ncbi:MAG: hypothetical protein AAB425_05395, partial [Bdellovibrionota bacterium]
GVFKKRAAVDREIGDWPYSTHYHHEIDRLRRKTIRVKAVIPVWVESEIPSEEAQANIQNWSLGVTDWYNCQTGVKEGCIAAPEMKTNPRIQFDIKFKIVPSPAEAIVRVSRCHNGELPAAKETDCAAIRDHRIERCMLGSQEAAAQVSINHLLDPARFPGPRPEPVATPAAVQPSSSAECEAATPPVGDPGNNRQDAGNFTLSTELSVLYHEVGHHLGLPDEYQDRAYSFNRLGETDSVMAYHYVKDTRLYPRHLEHLLGIAGCQ